MITMHSLPLQPNSSTLIDIWPRQAVGRMRMYRALTALDSSWKTTVLRSLFAANSLKRTQRQSVRDFTKVSTVQKFVFNCIACQIRQNNLKPSRIFSSHSVYWWADLRYTLSWLFIEVEVYTIGTVLQLVLGDPLIQISSSLAG